MQFCPKTKYRERLAGVQAEHYLGRNVTAGQVDSMTGDEVECLYARYEARLGATMTKTLKTAALYFYSAAASMFLPLPTANQPKLIADPEADPFVEHALCTAICELYHKYDMFLAPLTAALIMAKNCLFGPVWTQDEGP